MPEDYSHLRMHYVGQLRSPASWAHVGRELVLALDRLGVDISASGARGFLHDPHFPVSERLEIILDRPPHSDIILTFTFPPNYRKLVGDKKIGILVYETSHVPKAWADAINDELSLLVVPSTFACEIMVRGGVRPELVSVVPHGHDPERFHPAVKPAPRPAGDAYTFLTLAVPHKRKGMEKLLEAFVREFDGSQPIALVIYSQYAPAPGKEKPWETPDVRVLAEEARKKVSNPPNIIANVGAVADEDVPPLIAACDSYVQPSMSEGFGITILEAMSMEKPVIVTGWGGHMDFCAWNNCYTIDYDIVPAGDAQYDNDNPEALIASPGVASLRKLLRRVFTNPGEAHDRGRTARLSTRHLTWDAAAKKLVRLLLSLKDGET